MARMESSSDGGTTWGPFGGSVSARHAAAVTPNDGADVPLPTGITQPMDGLWVGGAGNLAVVMAGTPAVGGAAAVPGETVTFTGVPAGCHLPYSFGRIKATGTTATNLTAVWK